MPSPPRSGESQAQAVPQGGALGLLALGYRGLEAWRVARGIDWIAEKRSEWEAARAAAEDAKRSKG